MKQISKQPSKRFYLSTLQTIKILINALQISLMEILVLAVNLCVTSLNKALQSLFLKVLTCVYYSYGWYFDSLGFSQGVHKSFRNPSDPIHLTPVCSLLLHHLIFLGRACTQWPTLYVFHFCSNFTPFILVPVAVTAQTRPDLLPHKSGWILMHGQGEVMVSLTWNPHRDVTEHIPHARSSEALTLGPCNCNPP